MNRTWDAASTALTEIEQPATHLILWRFRG